MAETVPAFPLSWPAGWKRASCRQNAPFFVKSGTSSTVVPYDRAVRELEEELTRLGAKGITLSSNVERSISGRPISSSVADPGVAIYFTLNGKQTVLACDKWNRVADNIRALTKHIEALRGQERWGVGTTAQAFAGYQALPAPEQPWQVLGIKSDASIEEIETAHKRLAMTSHPDKPGGSNGAMARINAARDAAIASRSLT